MTCPILTGVLLVRACGANPVHTCERCQRRVCAEHVRTRGAPPAVVRVRCVDCIRSASSSRRDVNDDDYDSGVMAGGSSSGGDDDPAATLSGAGGEFGGAGATGDWDSADASTAAGPPSGTDPGTFTAEDFAAFDAITDSDKEQGSPGYDS